MTTNKPKAHKPMRCYLCNQPGHGPLSQDAYGYKHSYGCPTTNSTLKAESNSTIPLEYHKGKLCVWSPDTLCQENNCDNCMIYLDRTEGIT